MHTRSASITRARRLRHRRRRRHRRRLARAVLRRSKQATWPRVRLVLTCAIARRLRATASKRAEHFWGSQPQPTTSTANNPSTAYPSGCYYRQTGSVGMLYFNPTSSGMGTSNAYPICINNPCASASPSPQASPSPSPGACGTPSIEASNASCPAGTQSVPSLAACEQLRLNVPGHFWGITATADHVNGEQSLNTVSERLLLSTDRICGHALFQPDIVRHGNEQCIPDLHQ